MFADGLFLCPNYHQPGNFSLPIFRLPLSGFLVCHKHLFVLLNKYAAIGFIITVKGVARFKDFEERTFAEYVLIGTLLSALFSIVVAYIVKLILSI
jgi:hypothetical protein